VGVGKVPIARFCGKGLRSDTIQGSRRAALRGVTDSGFVRWGFLRPVVMLAKLSTV
jgi:hypothetical protein